MRFVRLSFRARCVLGMGIYLGMASGVFADENVYVQTVLIANKSSFNPTVMVDEHLQNPWGIALRPPGAGGHIWISNAGDGTTTTYIGDVNGIVLHQDGLTVIPINAVAEDPAGYSELTGQVYHATVTGQVYNAASDVPGQPVEFFWPARRTIGPRRRRRPLARFRVPPNLSSPRPTARSTPGAARRTRACLRR